MNEILLKVTGDVEYPSELTFADLSAIDPTQQIADVSKLAAGRKGDAVRLAGLLALVKPKPEAKYLNLHAATDNFHASIPLSAVTEKAIVIYRLDGQPLSVKAGGPVRFFIPDHKACHTDEIDECANVKFVDTIELAATRGFDNRPHDEKEHAELHAKGH
ncbi:MAG: molybdopterin-dependent oxidoreductase [Planctomycetales bacterium]|nr:molybdopterin-dependent oxidoreductase [Planctomycetales bacterium]